MGRDPRKRGIELGAETVDHRDNRDRNTGRDQTVFDSGGTGLIAEEAGDLGLGRPQEVQVPTSFPQAKAVPANGRPEITQ